MSLSLPKKLFVALCPDRIGIAAAPAWGIRVSESVGLDVPAGNDRGLGAPLATLDQWLTTRRFCGVALHLTLSDEFARYVVVPPSNQVGGAREFQALTQACFEAVHGTEIGDFEIVCDSVSRGRAALACAIRRDELQRIRALCSGNSLRLHSLQPAFTRAVNRWHRQIKRPAVILMPERRSVTGGIWNGQEWASVWRQPLAVAPTAEELMLMLRRESLLRGASADAETIVLRGAAQEEAAFSGLPVRFLPALDSGSLGLEYPVAMACLDVLR